MAREQEVNVGLAATASELNGELELTRANTNGQDGYDDIVVILCEEAKMYQTHLSETHNETQL